MSGATLIALWPSGFAYLLPMNHGSQKKPIATYSDPPPSSTFLPSSLFYTFFVSRASQFFSVSCLSLTASPLHLHQPAFTRRSPCLGPAPCIPSCLIKACIINTAISLSILLPCSYDCYIKCKLFRCNSLLMSLL